VDLFPLEQETERIDEIGLVVGDQDSRLDGAHRVHDRWRGSKARATNTFGPELRPKGLESAPGVTQIGAGGVFDSGQPSPTNAEC
jgi:hypothetical protein